MNTGAQLDVDHLRSLQREFELADGGFTEQQFVEKFASIVGESLTTEQLTSLFWKIDANSDGTVDWDEFSNFMFLGSETLTTAEYIPRVYQRSCRRPIIPRRAGKSDAGAEPSTPIEAVDTTHGELPVLLDQAALTNRDAFDILPPKIRLHEGLAAAFYAAATVTHPTSTTLIEEGFNAAASKSVGEAQFSGLSSSKGFQPKLPPRTGHNDLIIRMLYLTNPDRYVTASRDGVVCVWNEVEPNKLHFRQAFRTGNEWLADITYLPLSHKLVTITTEGNVWLFSLSFVTDTVTISGVIRAQKLRRGTLHCCDCYVAPNGQEVLLLGNDSGKVLTVKFSRGWHTCDGQLPSKCHRYEFSKGVSISSQSFGDQWITCVKYVADLAAIVVATAAGELQLYDRDTGKSHPTKYQHHSSITSFDWSTFFRVMAFCGGDRTVTLWNPYSKQKLASLPGHSAPVVQVMFNDQLYQLVALSKDLSVRVWDMRATRVIQIFRDDSEQGASPKWLPTMYVNSKTSALVTATRTLSVWPLEPLPGAATAQNTAALTQSVSTTGVTGAVYNEAFHLVISFEPTSQSTVYIWDANTGQLMSQFHNAHGRSPVTALIQDREHRRVLTGSLAGDCLKVWNFNNGALLKVFSKSDAAIGDKDDSAPGAALARARMHHRNNWRSSDMGKLEAAAEQGTIDLSEQGLARLLAEDMKEEQEYEMTAEGKFQAEAAAREEHITEADSAEVTQIIYVERMIAPVGGQSAATVQKFVCCVGCDNALYVFEDTSDDHGRGALMFKIPNKQDEAAGLAHNQDILCVAFAPPATLITGSVDGYIHSWSLNTGKHLRTVYNPHSKTPSVNKIRAARGGTGVAAVSTMVYAHSIGMVLAGFDSGQLLCIDIASGVMKLFFQVGDNDAAISAMTADRLCEILIVSDSHGWITVWDVVPETRAGVGAPLQVVARWKAHDGRVHSVSVMEQSRLLEMFVVSSGADGILLWTLAGCCVGQFGQASPWDLLNTTTYRSTKTQYIVGACDDVKACWLLEPKRQTREIRSSRASRGSGAGGGGSTAGRRRISSTGVAIDEATTTSRWAVPEPGQVWVRAVTNRDAGIADPTQLPDPCLIANTHVFRAMITVVRVTKDMVIGRCGLTDDSSRFQFVPLHEFTAPQIRDSAPWRIHEPLTARIGRVFSEGDAPPYRVLYVVQKSLEDFSVRDSELKVHRLPALPRPPTAQESLSRSVRNLLPPPAPRRCLSLFVYDHDHNVPVTEDPWDALHFDAADTKSKQPAASSVPFVLKVERSNSIASQRSDCSDTDGDSDAGSVVQVPLPETALSSRQSSPRHSSGGRRLTQSARFAESSPGGDGLGLHLNLAATARPAVNRPHFSVPSSPLRTAGMMSLTLATPPSASQPVSPRSEATPSASVGPESSLLTNMTPVQVPSLRIPNRPGEASRSFRRNRVSIVGEPEVKTARLALRNRRALKLSDYAPKYQTARMDNRRIFEPVSMSKELKNMVKLPSLEPEAQSRRRIFQFSETDEDASATS